MDAAHGLHVGGGVGAEVEFAAERHAQTFAHDNHVVIERGGAAFLEAEASHIGFQAAGQRDAAAVVADVGCARQGEAAAGLV